MEKIYSIEELTQEQIDSNHIFSCNTPSGWYVINGIDSYVFDKLSGKHNYTWNDGMFDGCDNIDGPFVSYEDAKMFADNVFEEC